MMGLVVAQATTSFAHAAQRPQARTFSAAVCRPTSAAPRRQLASLGEVNSIGVAYFAGRSRGGNDAHLAAALTTELASQLLSARPRSTGASTTDRRLVVKFAEGGVFSYVDFWTTGSLLRDERGVRTQLHLPRT